VRTILDPKNLPEALAGQEGLATRPGKVIIKQAERASKWSHLRQMNQSKRTETSSEGKEENENDDDHILDTKQQSLGGYAQQTNDQDSLTRYKQPNANDRDECISVPPKIKSVVIRPKESSVSEDQEDFAVQRVQSTSPFPPNAGKTVGRLESDATDVTMRGSISGPESVSSKETDSGSDTRNSNGNVHNLAPDGMSDSAKNGSSETEKMAKNSTRQEVMGDELTVTLVSSENDKDIANENNRIASHDIETVTPMLSPVILSSSGTTNAKTNPRIDRSPKPPQRSVSKRTGASETNSWDRLKKANELIQQQERKKEASRSTAEEFGRS
jgi:hypothetical protein